MAGEKKKMPCEDRDTPEMPRERGGRDQVMLYKLRNPKDRQQTPSSGAEAGTESPSWLQKEPALSTS